MQSVVDGVWNLLKYVFYGALALIGFFFAWKYRSELRSAWLEMLAELRTMIGATHQTKGMFHANHASNYLPIRARMPNDKEKTLSLIDSALDGKVALKPEWMRAL